MFFHGKEVFNYPIESFFPMKNMKNTKVVMALRAIFILVATFTMVSCYGPMDYGNYAGGGGYGGGYSNYGGQSYGQPPPQYAPQYRQMMMGAPQQHAYHQVSQRGNYNATAHHPNLPGVRHSAASLEGGYVVRHKVTVGVDGKIKDEVAGTQEFDSKEAITTSMKARGVEAFPFSVPVKGTLPMDGVKTAQRANQ